MNITLRQLHVFQSVATTRNFSRTGDAVGLTQPAVSRCITELEAQLGLKLLNRTTREVTLTDAGQRLSARLPRVLEELENTLLDVREMATERRGRVRVASSPTLSANLMPDCIAECQRTLPGLELVLLDRIQSAVLASVLSGEVDFGVVIDPSEREALHCETILTEPFCLACPPSHRLAGKRQVRWTDLQGEALVLLDHDSGSRRLIDRALAEHGVACTVAQEVGHPSTIFRMLCGLLRPTSGAAVVAGQDLLRSKSLDRNSFDSGDWFNRLDWRYRDHYFGSGLPPAPDNAKQYPFMRPLLRQARIKPDAATIR